MLIEPNACNQEFAVCFPAGITILLALTVYMLIIADELPPTPQCVPLIGESEASRTCEMKLK